MLLFRERIEDTGPKKGGQVKKRDMLLMMLEAVYVDVPNKRLVAFQVKPAFKPLFRVSLERKEPHLLSVRFGHSDIVHGDPEGIRTPDLHRDRVAC